MGLSASRWDPAIFIALGSNLPGAFDSPTAALEAALTRFPDLSLKVRSRSSWWASRAWPEGAGPDYVNAVVAVETPLPARSVLGALLGLEAAFGRIRIGKSVGAARALDLDLIAYGRRAMDEPGLVLPHPRATERLFVMGPLAEIAPDWRCPRIGKTAADLALQARVGLDAHPVPAA